MRQNLFRTVAYADKLETAERMTKPIENRDQFGRRQQVLWSLLGMLLVLFVLTIPIWIVAKLLFDEPHS